MEHEWSVGIEFKNCENEDLYEEFVEKCEQLVAWDEDTRDGLYDSVEKAGCVKWNIHAGFDYPTEVIENEAWDWAAEKGLELVIEFSLIKEIFMCSYEIKRSAQL